MSYRSIKRVLGETSLERKCRFLFGACLLLLISGSFWLYGFQTEKMVYERNRDTGRLLVDQVMYLQHWENWTEKGEGARQLIRALGKNLRKQSFEPRIIRPHSSKSPHAPRDDYELGIVRDYSGPPAKRPFGGDPERYPERLVDNNNTYEYFQPIYADKTCLDCHPFHPGEADPSGTGIMLGGNATASVLHDGDLMVIVKVTIPNAPTQHKLNVNRGILIATAILTVFLAMVAAYVIVRYVIVKPLRHLRDVSDAISRGNTSLRADIHTGDEFEELSVAFNRMLRHMTDAQSELRSVNANLDGKVDELAQANMRLYELNMLKSDFMATMSHELRTPLNSILGFSEVLGSIDAMDEKQKRYVQNIQKSGRTLLEMINDILDLAKMESGKMEVRPSDFRVAQVVSAQCDMARPLTERKNIDLEVHADGELPPMHQDQARVQQILNNLLSNAIKFTPEGGRITVSVHRDEANFMVLEVSDTGVGIAPEDQLTIFEKFRQGKTAMPDGDAMTREHSGSGLGLSIVKELCKLLGGEVSVRSELGKGSTFTIRLPWLIEEQPRVDAALIEGFEDFAKQRFEPTREHSPS
jgi:two-component system, NarL family, sensor histidine kinase BarA